MKNNNLEIKVNVIENNGVFDVKYIRNKTEVSSKYNTTLEVAALEIIKIGKILEIEAKQRKIEDISKRSNFTPSNEKRKVLNVKELAVYLRCSDSSIRTMVRENKIPFFKVESRIFFEKNKVDEWINDQY